MQIEVRIPELGELAKAIVSVADAMLKIEASKAGYVDPVINATHGGDIASPLVEGRLLPAGEESQHSAPAMEPAPEKKTRGRPKSTPIAPAPAPAPAAPAPAAPAPAAPAPAAPVASMATDPHPDKAQLVAVLTNYRNKNGRDEVLKLLAKHGGKDSLSSVPIAAWPTLYAEAKAGV